MVPVASSTSRFHGNQLCTTGITGSRYVEAGSSMLAGLLLFTRAQCRTAASPLEVAILAGASRDSNAAGDSGRGVSKLSAIYENPGGGAIFVPWTRLQEIGPSLHCSPSISRCGLVTRVRPVVLTHKVVLGMFDWKIALESPHEKSGLRGSSSQPWETRLPTSKVLPPPCSDLDE